MARQTLTDLMVKRLKPGAKRRTIPDPLLVGHYVRVQPSGAKSYCAVARDPYGNQKWATVGSTDHFAIDDARELAREAIKRVKAGLDPFPAPPAKPDTFEAVAENYLERHVRAKGLRSQDEIERCFNFYIYPIWRDREFTSIRRSDVAKLLDLVQDNHGPRQADLVLAHVRKCMNWHASRSDDYASPVVPGMGRVDPLTSKRTRILDDDELRLVWGVAERNGTYGALVRLALLTAQRQGKIVAMAWDDVSVDGVWTIPAEDREKDTGGALALPDEALAIIRDQKRIGKNPYVFAGRGDGHFRGFSPWKRAFDDKTTNALREAAKNRGDDPAKVKPLPHWVFHDLRRSSKSLMSRAGVRPDISERVMGHAMQGVEGVYDRHSYRDEKAEALRRLAGLIETILNPPTENVVAIREAVE